MPLFKIDNQNVTRVIAKDLDLEKNLQSLFEKNLDEILNITFLAHEYSTSFGGRIDTLGIDKTGSPCVIEYKRNQNDNVINQGLSYLKWLLDHKADFEMLCREKNIETEVQWDSPRVICIAESYNKFDIDTADILPINVELYKYRIYQNDTLYLDTENFQKVRIPTSKIIKKAVQEKEKTEVLQKSYAVDDHLKKTTEEVKNLFFKLREKIVALDESIKEEPQKFYIAYKLSTNFADIEFYKNHLKIFLNIKSGRLEDPRSLARDMEKPKHIGHHGNGDYEVKLGSEDDINAVFALIKQSYDLNK